MPTTIYIGASAPGASAPASDKAPGVCSTEGPKDRASTCLIFGQPADHCKALATLQARAALAGCVLHPLADGAFLLSRWGLARELADLNAVEALLDRIGGAR